MRRDFNELVMNQYFCWNALILETIISQLSEIITSERIDVSITG
jgi:hypothetical protein